MQIERLLYTSIGFFGGIFFMKSSPPPPPKIKIKTKTKSLEQPEKPKRNKIKDPVYILFQDGDPESKGLERLCTFHGILQPGDKLPDHSRWYIEKHSLYSYLFESMLWNGEHDTVHGPSKSLQKKMDIYDKIMKENENEPWNIQKEKFFEEYKKLKEC